MTLDPFLIQEVNVVVPFSTSDHNRVEFKLNCNNTVLIHSNDKLFTDYSAVDWDCFNDYMCNVDWSDVYSAHDSADERWSAFSSTLNDAVVQFAPTNIKHVRKSAAQSYPYPIRKLITKKASIWKKGKNFQHQRTP